MKIVLGPQSLFGEGAGAASNQEEVVKNDRLAGRDANTCEQSQQRAHSLSFRAHPGLKLQAVEDPHADVLGVEAAQELAVLPLVFLMRRVVPPTAPGAR